MRILVVDDDEVMRLLLSRILQKWGYEVTTAVDGIEAWEILQKENITFVISDWIMPRMDGLQLCEKIREGDFPVYIYIILLTAKKDKADLIKGMEAGADDFIVKPFNKGELKVRIKAGERILRLEHELELRNRELLETNKKLRDAYLVIKKDLEAAAKIQRSLLPASAIEIKGIFFDWIFSPCSFVAGDIFNFFSLDENNVCFYLLDVSGHGIPAALLSVSLSKILSPSISNGSPLKYFIPKPPYYEIASPKIAVKKLNTRFLKETKEDAGQYFTMIYGIVNTKNDQITLTQAGHPSPIYIPKEGKASLIGQGGFPVGMIPDVEYDEIVMEFKKGDRLFIYSDGITECTNKDMEMFSENRLMKLLEEGKNLPLKELMKRVQETLLKWKGSDEFEDDITLVGIEKG